MGIYLNSKTPYTLYKNETAKPFFVDKTAILGDLIPLAEEGSSFVCITRPRRFGKTVMANLIGAYFSRACASGDIFDTLQAGRLPRYRRHLNRHNVISIDFSDIDDACASYDDYISRIKKRLKADLRAEYEELNLPPDSSVSEDLTRIFEETGDRFLFVLDEWDAVFHASFTGDGDRKRFLLFLKNLLKGRAYVSLAYMTGILPIAKYSSGSELNMFAEYTMASEERFSGFFGFTDREVDELYGKYLTSHSGPKITREGLRDWYDGYHTRSGERVYNPRSVVLALTNNNLGNYWTSSGPYDEIFYYIEQNVADVRDDLALMVSGTAVPARIREYAATSMNLTTRDEIFSAMVVYGFLSYENGNVMIPNRELMNRFADMLLKEPSLGYIHRLARESERMLAATLRGDTEMMASILALVHNTETPLLNYNNETELAAIVNLVYLAARDSYRIEREDKAGIGYVDFIFYPLRRPEDDCIILELKIDQSPEAAVRQIKERQYALRFLPKLGERPYYTGRILAVGIAYDRISKKHGCAVEILRPGF